MLAAISKRWDAAIADALRRADLLLARASVASDAEIVHIGSDFQALSRLWTKAEADLRPLGEEISETWDALSDELSDAGAPEGVMREEGAKRDLATCELEIRRTRAHRLVMANAAERLRGKAEELGDDALRATFVGVGARYLGEWAAQVDWERMARAQTRINAYRDKKAVPIALLKELESSARSYFKTVLEVEAQHAPLQRPYVEAKIERFMKDIERTLRQHWQWRSRG
jgi:hypothetical protein